MLLATSIHDLRPARNVCLTIGNFDGAHLGHQALIERARQLSQTENLDFVLVTFWPHPRLVLPGASGHTPLTGRQERLRLLADLGVENILELPFTPAMAALSAEEFIKNYLLPLNMRRLVVGHDFSLGKGRGGNADFLRKAAKKWNFTVSQLQPVLLDGLPISSTRLRNCIKSGAVAEAARLLGRRHAVQGEVEHGYGRGGSLLGFPTANLGPVEVLLPGDGVYASLACHNGHVYRAVTNIGRNPTFNSSRTGIESFLLDANVNLYGQTLRLEFVKRLRAERRFDSAGDLAAQINNDVAQAREILANEAQANDPR